VRDDRALDLWLGRLLVLNVGMINQNSPARVACIHSFDVLVPA
jgi:hypothetical protein